MLKFIIPLQGEPFVTVLHQNIVQKMQLKTMLLMLDLKASIYDESQILH